MEPTLDLHQSKGIAPAQRATLGGEGVPALLRTLPLMNGLPDTVKLAFAAHCQLVPVKRGDVIFAGGDKARNLYIINRGWVKIARETLDGSEAVLDVFCDGQLFGEQAVFSEGHVYTATATAVDDTVLLVLPLPLFLTHLQKEPALALGLLRTLAGRQRLRDMELESRTLKNAPQRIGCFLLRLCPLVQPAGEVVIHLPYDKTLLAGQMGMQPETFSRALSRLKSDLALGIKGSSITVSDMRALRQYACGGCSGTYPCQELRAGS